MTYPKKTTHPEKNPVKKPSQLQPLNLNELEVVIGGDNSNEGHLINPQPN